MCGFGDSGMIWILILLMCCGGGMGFCGEDNSMLLILVLLMCCGNNNGLNVCEATQ